MITSTPDPRKTEYAQFRAAWLNQVRCNRAFPHAAYKFSSVLIWRRNCGTGEASASQAWLRAKAGISETYLRRLIRLFEAQGIPQVTPGDGRRDSRYRFLIIGDGAAAEHPSEARRAALGHPPVHPQESLKKSLKKGEGETRRRARPPGPICLRRKKPSPRRRRTTTRPSGPAARGQEGIRGRARPRGARQARRRRPQGRQGP